MELYVQYKSYNWMMVTTEKVAGTRLQPRAVNGGLKPLCAEQKNNPTSKLTPPSPILDYQKERRLDHDLSSESEEKEIHSGLQSKELKMERNRRHHGRKA